MAHSLNLNSWEVEAGGSSKGQPLLHRKKRKNKIKIQREQINIESIFYMPHTLLWIVLRIYKKNSKDSENPKLEMKMIQKLSMRLIR